MLTIVIPVFNNFNFTKSCLKDLSKLKETQIIIVDNGSTDDTININSNLNFEINDLLTIRNETNLGFAAACNIGYKNANYNNVMFLNNDIRVQKNHESWTNIILESLNDNNIVGPTMGLLNESFGFVKEENKLINSKLAYMSGWNLTAKKSVWNKLIEDGDCGPFSTRYFAYFEDTHLSFLAKEKGIEFSVVPVPVFHFGRTTGKMLNISELYLGSKNKFISYWKERIK
jgi:GT2 family glycosyltransferase